MQTALAMATVRRTLCLSVIVLFVRQNRTKMMLGASRLALCERKQRKLQSQINSTPQLRQESNMQNWRGRRVHSEQRENTDQARTTISTEISDHKQYELDFGREMSRE